MKSTNDQENSSRCRLILIKILWTSKGFQVMRIALTLLASNKGSSCRRNHYHPIFQANNGAAGFCFILALIFLLFKWRSRECPKALLDPVHSRPNTQGNSRRLPHCQILDAMRNSPLTDPTWDYRATFAGPTVTEKARQPLRKSLKLLQLNPLALNQVTCISSSLSSSLSSIKWPILCLGPRQSPR